jgi:hypothetical protein
MIIDAHVHCGRQDKVPPQDFETVSALERAAGVDAAVMTPPVMEIYDRHNPAFEDTPDWQTRRAHANDYLLHLSRRNVVPKVLPLVFIWNDFRLDELDRGYVGVKWHRHPDEPPYHYDAPACDAILVAIRERRLPFLVEEEFRWTLHLIDRLGPETPVIIPHVGHLNGGFAALDDAGVWERPNVWSDTSGGRSVDELRRYLDRCGPDRLMLGSDYPFCTPQRAREILADLRLPDADQALIQSQNAARLFARA